MQGEGNSKNIVKMEWIYLIASIFTFFEFFILFGIHFFWILYKWDLVLIEKTVELLALIAPFLLVYVVGIFLRIERYRVIFRKMEWFLHSLISACYFILLVSLQTRDEFNPFVPFTWLYYFWIFILGLDLVSFIVMTMDKPSFIERIKEKKTSLRFIGLFFMIWLIIIPFIIISRYALYFWIIASLFHLIMIPISLRKDYSNPDLLLISADMLPESIIYEDFRSMISRKAELKKSSQKQGVLQINSQNLRIFILIFFIFMAWNQWAFYHRAIGSLEDNYYIIIGMFLSPLFYIGFGLAFLYTRLEKPLIGDSTCLVIIALSLIQFQALAPLVLGYTLLTLMFINSSQPTTTKASTLVAVQLAWWLGLYLYTFNGMLVKISLAIVFALQNYAQIVIDQSFINENFINVILISLLIGVFIIYLMLLSIKKVLERKKKPRISEIETNNDKKGHPKPEIHEVRQIKKSAIVLLAIIIGGLISPFLFLSFTIKSPPISLPDKQRVELNNFCGTALAGYSGLEEEYNNLNELGVHWLRVHFSWRSVEPTEGQWDFNQWDQYMDDTQANGIKVIAMLNYLPRWLNLSTKEYVSREVMTKYLEYVERTVRRYKDTVAAWEIWNEPNLEDFWDGPMEDFYHVFNETANLIHSIDPNLYIIGGSLSSAAAGWIPGNLEDMFKAGIMTHVDALSFHYYNFDPDTLYAALMQYFAVGTKYSFKGDYFITELGNPTGGDYPTFVTMKELAENVIKFHVIASSFGIKTFIWYCTKDSGWNTTDVRNSERFFGLTYKDYSAWKQGAHAYKLFSEYCSTSTYCPDLIVKQGGVSAADLMAALYQKTDGTSALILWYSPTIHESGSIAVNLELSDIIGDAYIYDIYSGNSEILNCSKIEVGSSPVFITFKASNINQVFTITVEESAITIMIYGIMAGILTISIVTTVKTKYK